MTAATLTVANALKSIVSATFSAVGFVTAATPETAVQAKHLPAGLRPPCVLILAGDGVYTDSTLTCSLWGINPGYRVEYETVDWQEGGKATERTETDPELPEGYEEIKSYGKDGHSIVIERKVYDSKDNLHREDTL